MGTARRTVPSDQPLDPLEPGRAHWLPFAEAVRLALAGELLGAGSLVGVLALHAERTERFSRSGR